MHLTGCFFVRHFFFKIRCRYENGNSLCWFQIIRSLTKVWQICQISVSLLSSNWTIPGQRSVKVVSAICHVMQVFSGGKRLWTDNDWSFPKHVNKPVLTFRHSETDAVSTQKNPHCMYGCQHLACLWGCSENFSVVLDPAQTAKACQF